MTIACVLAVRPPIGCCASIECVVGRDQGRELTIVVDLGQLEAAAARWKALGAELVDRAAPAVRRFEALSNKLARSITEAFRDCYPPNWPDDWDGVAALIAETQWPLVWVPRREVIEQLLAAGTPDARDAVLLVHENDILEDCERLLRQVTDPYLRELADIESEAVVAYRSGAPSASQALSATLVTTLVHWTGFERLAEARRALDIDLMAVRLGDLRLAAIQSCIPSTLVRSERAASTTFNRHGTVHAVSRTHLTERNALVALMQVTAWLRQLDVEDEPRTHRLLDETVR